MSKGRFRRDFTSFENPLVPTRDPVWAEILSGMFNGDYEVGISIANEIALTKDKFIKVRGAGDTFETLVALNYPVEREELNERAKMLMATCKALTVAYDLVDESNEVVVDKTFPLAKLEEMPTDALVGNATAVLLMGAHNHFVANHTTAGNRLPRACSKLLVQSGVVIESLSDNVMSGENTASDLKDFFYECAHPVNKRLLAKHFWGYRTGDFKDDWNPKVAEGFRLMVPDHFLNLRKQAIPAGCRQLVAIKVIAELMHHDATVPLFPDQPALQQALDDYWKAYKGGAENHVGASYYGFKNRKVRQEKHTAVFRMLSAYALSVHPEHSICAAPGVIAVGEAAESRAMADLIAFAAKRRVVVGEEDKMSMIVGEYARTHASVGLTPASEQLIQSIVAEVPPPSA